MEQFIFEDADGEYTDDFQTDDRTEALAYGQEHHLKVVRVYYVEAGTETIADFTRDEYCERCKPWQHDQCGADPSCPCCLETAASIAEGL